MSCHEKGERRITIPFSDVLCRGSKAKRIIRDNLDVELLIVVWDCGAEERRVAAAVGELARSTEYQSVDVRRCGEAPGRVPRNVGISCSQEGLVPCLHLGDKGCLFRVWTRDGAELGKRSLEPWTTARDRIKDLRQSRCRLGDRRTQIACRTGRPRFLDSLRPRRSARRMLRRRC